MNPKNMGKHSASVWPMLDLTFSLPIFNDVLYVGCKFKQLFAGLEQVQDKRIKIEPVLPKNNCFFFYYFFLPVQLKVSRISFVEGLLGASLVLFFI